jgi:hypothetical protein
VEETLREQAKDLVQILKGDRQEGDKQEADKQEGDKEETDQLEGHIAQAKLIQKAELMNVKKAIVEWNNATSLVNQVIMAKKTIAKVKRNIAFFEYINSFLS